VAIGVPTASVTGRLYEFLSLGAAGGFLVLVAGLGLAGHYSRKIAAGVQLLVRGGPALDDTAEARALRSGIREVDEVARRLDASTMALQRRTAERDRAERHKEIAEKATLLKDEFIATVSHELRTPLTAITASLALMEDDLDPHVGLETKELLDIAHANSRRLHRLVDDILDIEKLEAGKIAFHLGRVAVRPLLAQMIATDRALAARSGVALRLGPWSPTSCRTRSSSRRAAARWCCRPSGATTRCASRCATTARAFRRISGAMCSRNSPRPTIPTRAPRAAPGSG
jgi:signal transduction histidine kinase